MKQYDYLIVGSGLFGATFAHLAKQHKKKCLIIDKRPQLGGNIYCENIDGINVHTYGPHIFHTSDKQVWDFVSSLIAFNNFRLSPIANYRGKLYNLPFNMNTFYQMWGVTKPEDALAIIEKQRNDVNINPQNLEEQAVSLVGTDIYEILIKGYTEKQWGRPCVELPAFIIRRLPVRFTFDNNYFNDKYQGVPTGGYNKLIEKLLEGIDIKINCNFFDSRKYFEEIAEKIVFTGKIDEFYDYCFGQLDYRTVRWDTEILEIQNYQGVAVMNYTDKETPFTRIIEHKHFELGTQPKTIISREYSEEYMDGKEPMYPVNDEKNNDIYAKYKELANKEKDVIFGGRLAEYKYYDMDKIIASALSLWKNISNMV
jgi:UDP-galactopyranose mutase